MNRTVIATLTLLPTLLPGTSSATPANPVEYGDASLRLQAPRALADEFPEGSLGLPPGAGVSLASADFDTDGFPDLAVGHVVDDYGFIAL